MNSLRLIIRNIRYYFRSWILVAAGAMLGTTVLTGALITGDSVKYSLEKKVQSRLGKTRFALASPDKFFRSDLGRELSDSLKCNVVPLLLTDGMAVNPDQKISVSRINIIGVDETFSSVWDKQPASGNPISPRGDEAFLSRSLAGRLNLHPGNVFLLKIKKEGFAPGNAPFVYEKTLTAAVRLKVKTIAGDCCGGSFSLISNQSATDNVFISREMLASLLEVPGFVNTLLVFPENKRINAEKLDCVFQNSWNYEDAGLVLKKLQYPDPGKGEKDQIAGTKAKPAGENLYQVSSRRIFIQDTIASAILQGLASPIGILTYLVNDIRSKGRSTPYSFVSAMAHGSGGDRINGNEIIINNWLATDLQVRAGDSLTLRYFIAGVSGTLRESSSVFVIRSVTDIMSFPYSAELMPDFPGIKSALNCRDWETGVPVDVGRIREKDEAYWRIYKGTPKAFISLDQGQKIWKNPFGSYSAVRFVSHEKDAGRQITRLVREIPPTALGLAFIPVYDQGMHSAKNSTDMGGLFLSLGILIVISGLLLSGMMYSFFLQNRAEEAALLYSTGFRKQKLLRLFLSEALIFSITAGLAGTALAIGYTRLMLYALNTLWQGAVHTSILSVHLLPGTLVTGFLSGILISLIVFSGVLMRNLRRPLASAIRRPRSEKIKGTVARKRISLVITVISLAIATVIILAGTTRSTLLSSQQFMAAGMMVLLGMISLVYYLLIPDRYTSSFEKGGWLKLVFQNAGINRSRTVTAVAMLALGTFTILITGANRKMAGNDTPVNRSGSGGFLYWIQSSVPFRTDLNSVAGRIKTGLEDEPLVKKICFVNLCMVKGDDASCLNLNRVKNPQLIGVPCGLFNRFRAFSFTGFDHGTHRQHPWLSLQDQKSENLIPGYADQTVITWGLGKKLGDTIQYRDEAGHIFGVYLAGGLDNSIFQGNILVSDSLLRKYYPSTCGSNIILARNAETDTLSAAVEHPASKGIEQESIDVTSLARILETRLHEYGAVVTPASSRLAEFNSVENTYLSVFMMLGGLGVLLGTIGLALLLLKNMLERRFEVALYTALGFPEKLRKKLIFSEYFFILVSGLVIGITSAFLGSMPVLLSSAGSLPWFFTGGLVLLVFVNGIFWIFVAMSFLPHSDPAKILRSE